MKALPSYKTNIIIRKIDPGEQGLRRPRYENVPGVEFILIRKIDPGEQGLRRISIASIPAH